MEVKEQLCVFGSLSPPLCRFGNPIQVARVTGHAFSLLCHLAGSFYYVYVSVVCMYGCEQSDHETFFIFHKLGHVK